MSANVALARVLRQFMIHSCFETTLSICDSAIAEDTMSEKRRRVLKHSAQKVNEEVGNENRETRFL